MTRILLSTAVGLLLAASSQATTITFTTSGQLSCGSNATCTPVGNSLSFASTLPGGPALTVVYNPGGDNAEVPPTASANFGSIALACAGCTTANNAAWSLAGSSASVTFLQSAPSAGSAPLSGSFSSSGLGWSGPSGVSGGQTGLGLFTWDAALITIPDGVNEPIGYSVFAPTVLLQLGNNSIQGLVAVVPEPSSLALLGLGLLGMRKWARSGRAAE